MEVLHFPFSLLHHRWISFEDYVNGVVCEFFFVDISFLVNPRDKRHTLPVKGTRIGLPGNFLGFGGLYFLILLG